MKTGIAHYYIKNHPTWLLCMLAFLLAACVSGDGHSQNDPAPDYLQWVNPEHTTDRTKA
ncbi:MAG: hypothetical protein GDA42_01670 [Ekhidna sp.]|nr:hypothetical protein [Ekhidna sp.]